MIERDDSTPHFTAGRPSLARQIIGAVRLIGCLVTIVVAGLLCLPAALLPGRWRGVRWPVWLLTLGTRALLWWTNTAVTVTNPALIRRHAGFLVANHQSYIDIGVLGAITPVRFLSKAEVRSLPVIGWIARAVDCVFVERDDANSRHAARDALARTDRFPPVVIFPEGACSFDPQGQPWHVGSFVVASQAEIPVLPCAISYEPWPVAATIPGETELQTVWRLMTFPGPLRVHVEPLPVAQPFRAEDPARLAEDLRTAVQQLVDARLPAES